MSEGRYNIPKQYKVDKGMPLEALFQRIENVKCRQIFETEVDSITWSFQITDENAAGDVAALVRMPGISVFEVIVKHPISADLLTEVMAGLIPKRFIVVYLCNGELSMGAFIPGSTKATGKMCVTDFYPYDASRMIEVLDFKEDCDKTVEQIHNRILSMLRQQKRIIMIEKAFENVKKQKTMAHEPAYDFSKETLDKIRQDAVFVQEQLRVAPPDARAVASAYEQNMQGSTHEKP